MQILLVKSDDTQRSAFAFILNTEFGISVKEANSMQVGLNFLLDDANKFDLLICDDSAENQKLLKYLLTGDGNTRALIIKDPNVPSILAFPDLIAGYINPSNISDELKKHFAEKLNSFKPEPKGGVDADYCRIRAQTALQKFPLMLDLFVRLSAEKYVRVFKKGDSFTEKDITNFLTKKQIEYLFCQKGDAVLLAKKLKEDMERDFKLATATPEGGTKAAAAAQEAAIELGNRIGFTPEVQAVAKQGIVSCLKTIGNGKPQLAKIVRGIMAEKDKYVGSHAILTAQFACSLANGLSWSSETTYHKLTFAAFFHDMIITNNKLAQVKDLAELERRKSEFTEEEYKRYKQHPSAIAQIIKTFSEVPPDVDLIIAQHHERPNGTGFPRGLSAQNIAPLSAVFIIAHDLVDYIFDNGMRDIELFFGEYKEKYSQGHFKKMLASIDLNKIGLDDAPAVAPPKV